MSMAEPSNPEGNPLDRIANAVYSPFAMLAGMQLDLFTPLQDGPMSAEQIATAIDVGSSKLKPLLYALVAAGLLNVEGELFSNTSVADRFLVRDCPSCMVDSHEAYSLLWSAVLKTAETIRTGIPQAKLDYSAMSQEELETFFRGQHPETLAYGRELAFIFDLSSCRTLVDVSGGSGGLAIALTEACPYMQATIVDLPAITPITQRFIEEANAKGRIQVISSDVVRDSLPGSYDIAVMSAFIQVLSPDNARRALKNVSQVINPGGTIYIRGSGIIDNSRISPPEKVGLNLVFINVYDEGQAYTEQEYQDWLSEVGFVNFERINVPNGGSWLTAQKIG